MLKITVGVFRGTAQTSSTNINVLRRDPRLGRKEGSVLFNDALNTFYLRLYGVRHIVNDHSDSCRHMGYSFRLAARVVLYASSHRQDNTHHDLCYTSRGVLAGKRNSSMCPHWRIDPTTHRTTSERCYHGAPRLSGLSAVSWWACRKFQWIWACK